MAAEKAPMPPMEYSNPTAPSSEIPPEAYPADDTERYRPTNDTLSPYNTGASVTTATSSKAAEAAAEAVPFHPVLSADSIPAEAYPTSDATARATYGSPVDSKGLEPVASHSRLPTSHSSNSIPSAAYPSYHGGAAPAAIPTVADPFNFPETEALPAYSPPQPAESTEPQPPRPRGRLIAIPQAHANASAPFLDAYPECLLARGITEETWRSFMKAMSAFLTAKVSDRAISHAGDMAKSLGEGPRRLGKDIASQSKSLGKQIARHAKKGNVIGVAAAAIVGVVTIPIFTAIGAAGTVASLPNAAVAALSKKPKTPESRAFAYATVANDKWLHPRNLHAQLADSNLLAQMLCMPTAQFLQIAKSGKQNSAIGQLEALEVHLEPLKLLENTSLDLVDNTLWLLVLQDVTSDQSE
ncbi:hypothetical protein VHEMI06703 [[Torrubiella] hemipterigena]|uniref:Uncharacterized protein n=1 Tax=[Torrubiella] hemipterigena TaxID=1531966 RepID=A0A0A1T830_9HYPO|nr:hypothetical protein VHEMI06703 [[Torrubiella] hemipterigena]